MIKIEDYMIKDLKLSGTDLLVYADLITHMDKGYCNITQEQIAQEIGGGLRTVNRSIAYLKNKKIIEIQSYTDGYKRRNCIVIKDDIANMNNCEELKKVLEAWENHIGVKEALTIEVYKAWKTYIKNSGDKYFEKIIEAIYRYGNILKDFNYYKSYIYNIKKFFDYKFADYLDKGIEWTEYQRFKAKQPVSFTSSDSEYKGIPEEAMYRTKAEMEELRRKDPSICFDVYGRILGSDEIEI